MATNTQQIIEKYQLKSVFFALHILNAIIHVVLTNLPGEAYAITKVLLMPLLCLFFVVSVVDLKKGKYIAWALCGLWLGNICLIWGEESKILFLMGSAFTVLGIFSYLVMLNEKITSISTVFALLQMPIIWSCTFFVFFMAEDLGNMLLPISLYMSLIALVCMLALAQLMNARSSKGAWMIFLGSIFYIAENGLYTADHYMVDYSFGPNIVHSCFIMAQTLIVCGYLRCEQESQQHVNVGDTVTELSRA